ncbi:hypothetical protein INT47_009235 [Mucor saturninus]|uniref:Uncharacterized protein n=1 Tax=Mucor saturninus TaxID=64648 RepID=A0A8H7URA3_9FUNG|nr:hypothetical protein INT47_009235 [Mucor saturninus]
MFFVNACRCLTKPSISEDDIEEAHHNLEQFGKGCEQLYEPDLLSPNMHLHLHLCETILDFGPVYSYWLFGFERYNSILKNINTNRRSGFEATYMRSFIEDTRKGDFVRGFLDTPSGQYFSDVFSKLTIHQDITSTQIPYLDLSAFSLPEFLEFAENPLLTVHGNEPLPPSTLPLKKKPMSIMPRLEYNCLVEYYQVVHGDKNINSCKDTHWENGKSRSCVKL